MSDARRSRTPDPTARATELRPAPAFRADHDFVTPWADETTLVVDISGDEPMVGIEGDPEVLVLPMQQWLGQLAEVRSEIRELKAEIRRLREAVGPGN